MKKILFGITSLTLGGAEKVLVDLANELSKKYDVTILTIYAKGEFEKKLNSKVKLKSIYDFQFDDMPNFKKKPIDGNEAVARIAYKMSDMFAIYPITPSSPMGELADQFSASGEFNIFGLKPSVTEMQSEAGAAGALHGALQTGSLASTFTCSQGLLLMIPNMYKIAGEMTPCVIHVAARALAAQGLSIFGDHQDVMAVRQTGFAMLSSGSVQEAHDSALIAHLSTLDSKVPFINFFDGFRTSHEINKIELIDDETIKSMINEDAILECRNRALKPDDPVMRGTAQNPDVYFQGRESTNKYYNNVPSIVQAKFDEFAKLTGRQYHLFDYYGPADAENVIVMMGSGVQAVKETMEVLNKNGEKVGVLQVRLFRPFSAKHLVNALPKTVKKIAVLDRTKEPGSEGEPLFLDVVAGLKEEGKESIEVIKGRYGLSSKEFTPAMAKAVYDNLKSSTPKKEFIESATYKAAGDDVTKLSEIVKGTPQKFGVKVEDGKNIDDAVNAFVGENPKAADLKSKMEKAVFENANVDKKSGKELTKLKNAFAKLDEKADENAIKEFVKKHGEILGEKTDGTSGIKTLAELKNKVEDATKPLTEASKKITDHFDVSKNSMKELAENADNTAKSAFEAVKKAAKDTKLWAGAKWAAIGLAVLGACSYIGSKLTTPKAPAENNQENA